MERTQTDNGRVVPGLKEYQELQIEGSTEDNSKIIFLISQQKHIL